METGFCTRALEEAFCKEGKPEIFNTDQGSQFTSEEFTSKLKNRDIRISMDGKGRALDNCLIERFWRTIKYDDIYVKNYEEMVSLRKGIGDFIQKYNERAHQGLSERSPESVYRASKEEPLSVAA